MIFHKRFSITGVANSLVLDNGLEGTEKEPKRLISVLVQVDAYQANIIEGWSEKLQITEVPDAVVDTSDQYADTNMAKSGQRINEIPVALELPAGKVYQIGIRCGATPSNLIGCYVYELMTS